MEKKLMVYLSHFDVLDLIGFANIVGAQEYDDFEDYIIEIVQKFNLLPRDKRRELLQLAKEVAGWNKSVDEYNKHKVVE